MVWCGVDAVVMMSRLDFSKSSANSRCGGAAAAAVAHETLSKNLQHSNEMQPIACYMGTSIMNDINLPLQQEEAPPVLFIGHHESQRTVPINAQFLGQAQASGYDLLTAPITTDDFQSRVLAKLEDHVQELQAASSADRVPLPTISPLMPKDTDFTPEDSNSSIIGVVSPWVDLGSSDPLIAHISRQVFNLEVAYASFCGVSNVLVHGPIAGSDATQYARAILEGLGLGPYVQLHVIMPMTGELELEGAESAHLSELARPQYLPDLDEDDESEPELYASWETWNTIRTMCKYSTKLALGKCINMLSSPVSLIFLVT